jgi:hypothetical protein
MGKKIKSRAPGNRHNTPRGITAGCSEQTYPRHTSKTAYCCYRQVLTGFTAVRCTGPTLQRPLPFPYLTMLCLRPGIKPCYSGLQVQGTAGSPSGTANLKTLLYLYYTRKALLLTTDYFYLKRSLAGKSFIQRTSGVRRTPFSQGRRLSCRR